MRWKKGSIFKHTEETIMNMNAKEIVKNELSSCMEKKITERVVIKSNIKDSLGLFLYNKTKKRPIIMTIIMEI